MVQIFEICVASPFPVIKWHTGLQNNFVFWRSFVRTGQCCLCPSDKEGCPKRQGRPIDSRMNSRSHFLSPFSHVMSVQQPPSSRAAHKSIKCPLEEFAGISIPPMEPTERAPTPDRVGLATEVEEEVKAAFLVGID